MYFRKEEKEAESDKISWLEPPQQDHELYAPGAHAESWGGALGSPHLQTPLCFTLPAPNAAAAKVTLKGGQPCPQLTHPEG